jgi:hypothetical protein
MNIGDKPIRSTRLSCRPAQHSALLLLNNSLPSPRQAGIAETEQSCEQLTAVSPVSHLPLPQTEAAPQSTGQLAAVSPNRQILLPQVSNGFSWEISSINC